MKNKILLGALAFTMFMGSPASAQPDFSQLPPEIQAKMKESLAKQGYEQKLTELPSDSYQGDDKDKLIQMAKDEFSKQYPDEKILAARIQMDDWERYQDKRWSDGSESWYMVDYSSIQVLIAAPKDDKTAVLYPVNITKDHTDSEKFEVDAKTDRETNSIFLQEIPLENIN
jgi:hypothetical protein